MKQLASHETNCVDVYCFLSHVFAIQREDYLLTDFVYHIESAVSEIQNNDNNCKEKRRY